MPALGTWAWLESTGGRLRRRDRLSLLAQAVLAQARARWSSGRGRPAANIEMEQILPPDSAICIAAEAICAEASEPFLFNHCMRAYVWARLLNDQPSFDDEALYVSLLLHDLGLTERYRSQFGECFTLSAAREANRLAIAHGWDDRRARLVADAIALHLNVTVAARHGPEAQLVRIGSGADVAGFRLDRLSAGQRHAVVERFPRLGMKCEIDSALQRQVDTCPDCRIAFAYRRLDFGRMIRRTKMFAE